MSNNVHSFYQTLLRWQPSDAATLDLGVLLLLLLSQEFV